MVNLHIFVASMPKYDVGESPPIFLFSENRSVWWSKPHFLAQLRIDVVVKKSALFLSGETLNLCWFHSDFQWLNSHSWLNPHFLRGRSQFFLIETQSFHNMIWMSQVKASIFGPSWPFFPRTNIPGVVDVVPGAPWHVASNAWQPQSTAKASTMTTSCPTSGRILGDFFHVTRWSKENVQFGDKW